LKLTEYIPLALLSVLFCVLVARRSARAFPWFMAYVSFAVCADLARFVVRDRYEVYFFVYWITEGVYTFLGIAVMYEVFRRTFGNLGRFGWPRWIFLVMIVVSAVLTVGRGEGLPSGLPDRTIALIILGEIGVRFLQVLMFASLVTLVPLIGLQWKQYAFGIAMGFGVYSTIALLSTTRFSVLGEDYHLSWKWALIISYSCAVLIWLWFFGAAEKPDTPGSATPVLSLAELNIYRRLMRRINR
jgi:hypothetical protein